MKHRYRNLADYIERSGETQQMLADRLGVAQGTISHVMNGKSCSLKLAKRLSLATGVPLDTFGPSVDRVA